MLPAIKQELVLLASTFSVTFLVTVVIVSLNTIILPIQQGFFKIIYSKKTPMGILVCYGFLKREMDFIN